jgi:Holliday junction resolvase RusA-like endonuclease
VPTLSFIVPGVPKPQGSKTARVHNGKAVMFEAVKGAKEWRGVVVEHAWAAIQEQGWTVPEKETPVTLSLIFQFVRPASSKRDQPTVKPDCDKLVRNIGDSLTASGAIKDDSQITTIHATKVYGDQPGCSIEVSYA